ncbi:YqaJ viral recombinase family protein [Cytobacillus pseudoceanisediminis]|uniref:YqaJ viral recombinase family nuclease n=1 Tax=Cytobacillus pseudoceanisediminis TaxID=3051614 RepID=UPI003C2CF745
MQAKVLQWTRNMTHQEWLLWRKTGIGGSDVAAIFESDPWKSSYEVYLDKMGSLPKTFENEAMELGVKLKDFIAREFSIETNNKVRKKNAILQHPKYPYMIGTIDGWIKDQNAGLLCKNIHQYMANEWNDGKIPKKYLLQVMHYMAITGAAQWWIALLIGGKKLVFLKIDRDEALIKRIIEVEKNFWLYNVLSQQPPLYDGTKATREFLTNKYPTAKPKSVVTLPIEALDLVKQYKKAVEEEGKVQRKKLEAENRIKGLMGNNEIATVGDYKIEWKNVKKPSDQNSYYRRFQIK